MRIFPPFIDVNVDEGFANGNDIFGRKKIADQMTSLLGRVNEPIVLAHSMDLGVVARPPSCANGKPN